MGRLRTKMMKKMLDMADSSELNEITQAVLRRYDKLYSEEEVVFLSLPKHDLKERRRIIQSILSIEEHQI